MADFDKRMAVDVIEDTLGDLSTAQSRGMAIGLCGAFYMCGLINTDEWREYLKRIHAHAQDIMISALSHNGA